MNDYFELLKFSWFAKTFDSDTLISYPDVQWSIIRHGNDCFVGTEWHVSQSLHSSLQSKRGQVIRRIFELSAFFYFPSDPVLKMKNVEESILFPRFTLMNWLTPSTVIIQWSMQISVAVKLSRSSSVTSLARSTVNLSKLFRILLLPIMQFPTSWLYTISFFKCFGLMCSSHKSIRWSAFWTGSKLKKIISSISIWSPLSNKVSSVTQFVVNRPKDTCFLRKMSRKHLFATSQ